MTWAGIAAVGVIAGVEGLAAVMRQNNRGDLYAQAVQRADATKRTLVVVGDPYGGATHLEGACGDVCLDLTGCPQCPKGVKLDITTETAPIPDDSAVVFVSCVLEYVGDADAAWREITRMAGSNDNVFVVAVQPWTLTSRLYPGASRTVEQTPEGLEQSEVSPVGKLLLLLGLCGVGLWAVYPGDGK